VTTAELGKALDEQPAVAASNASGADESARTSKDDFERLRELLLGDERRELASARTRIGELERAQQDLPRRLPGAAVEALRSGKDNARVADALSEPVAQALGSAVQKNRQHIVDALFPIIGPMIRKAIAEALRGLVSNLNGAIESSFTLRGLQWRLEAWRGGVPYAQVVLKHRLTYGIDHVFLIEHGSGLVLSHASAPDTAPLDADAIAGMLTALGDFVDDSVGDDRGGALESAQVGEYQVWVEHGPRADLACFVRGVPPAQLRTLLEQRLEEIHAQFLGSEADARALGDNPQVQEQLRPAGLLREIGIATEPTSRRTPSRGPLLVIALVALALLGWFVVERMRWNTRVDALRARLAMQPGFVLTGIDARPWRSLTVHGLLDPDAPPLTPLFADADLGAVAPEVKTSSYVSADDAVIAHRAGRLLAPPPTVRVSVHERVLQLVGQAPQVWIDAATTRAAWIAGVAHVDANLATDVDPALVARVELDRLLATLADASVPFLQDAQSAPGAEQSVDAMAETARRATALAQVANVGLAFFAYGSNDESGSEETNARVREQRAQWLALALAARGIDHVQPASAADGGPNRRGAYLRATIGEHAQ
jgi:hypothetical protein